jgi:hypothetical protein
MKKKINKKKERKETKIMRKLHASKNILMKRT